MKISFVPLAKMPLMSPWSLCVREVYTSEAPSRPNPGQGATPAAPTYLPVTARIGTVDGPGDTALLLLCGVDGGI